MYWNERPDPMDWIDQIKYFSDESNDLSADELRDAFIHLAHLYATDFSNLRIMEDTITTEYGEDAIDAIWLTTKECEELLEIDQETDDTLGSTLALCDYIKSRWFSK